MKRLRRFLKGLSHFVDLRYQVQVVAYARMPNSVRLFIHIVDAAWFLLTVAVVGALVAGIYGAAAGAAMAALIQLRILWTLHRDVEDVREQINEILELNEMYSLPAAERRGVTDDD